MATKKQRRRRGKYEYVFVDEDGNEVEQPKAGAAPAKAGGKAASSGAKTGTTPRRGVREAKPPSWPRAAKWAGVYGILMLLFTLSTAKKGSSPAGGVLAAVLFAVVFLPGIYYLHRLQYRTYLRQLEKQGKSKG